jgi:Leucine-rich repeat (LRR) protein
VVLVFSHNRLTKLPDPLPESLIRLNCDHNELTDLTVVFPKSLKYFDCSHNHITNLSDELPESLVVLNCSDNPIMSLPNHLTVLSYLDISLTRVTSLPDTLSSEHLVTLEWSDERREQNSLKDIVFASGITRRLRNVFKIRQTSATIIQDACDNWIDKPVCADKKFGISLMQGVTFVLFESKLCQSI